MVTVGHNKIDCCLPSVSYNSKYLQIGTYPISMGNKKNTCMLHFVILTKIRIDCKITISSIVTSTLWTGGSVYLYAVVSDNNTILTYLLFIIIYYNTLYRCAVV